jgi:anti-sigma factor RsiW
MTPSICDTIETTAMVYLDDELAGTERQEFELHLHACGACRDHVERERQELAMVRGLLARQAPPPVSDLLRARVVRGLDRVDAELLAARPDDALAEAEVAVDEPATLSGRVRRLWLPAAAAVAAAAAIVLFALTPTAPAPSGEAVAHEAVRQELAGAPLEVQGASTAPWLDRHFRPGVRLPAFADDQIRLLGARLTALGGQPAAQLFYAVTRDGVRHDLVAFVVDDVAPGRLRVGRAIDAGGRRLYATAAYGAAALSYVDASRRGYVFTSRNLSIADLRDVVTRSNLIDDAGDRVR